MQQLEIDFGSTSMSVRPGARPGVDDQQPVDHNSAIAALWRQIGHCKRQLHADRAQLDELLNWLNREIADDRIDVADALCDLTDRLLQHAHKRSLARWQRHEIGLWILDNLESLDNLGRDTGELVQRYRQSFRHFYRQPDSGDSRDDSDWLSRILRDLHSAESPVGRADDNTVEVQSLPEGRTAAQPAADGGPPVGEALLKRMFRRTARVLHPDRSGAQPGRQEALMKTLLEARRNGDIAAILELYLEHAGDVIGEANHAELEHFHQLLQTQLQALQRARASLAEQSALHGWVVEHLLDKGERERLRALGTMRGELYELARQARALTRRVRTLASLKPLLAQRYDARHWVAE